MANWYSWLSPPLFRLRGIPVSLGKAEIRDHLIDGLDIGSRESLGSEALKIYSLAHSPWDTSKNTAVWTVTSKINHEALDGKIIQCSCKDCKLEGSDHGSTMIVDSNFEGLTSIYSPAEYDVDWEIDIVALSGWGRHPIRAFQHEREDFLWLRDELPKDIPTARIFTYGYGAFSFSSECSFDESIKDWGSDIVEALESIRSGMLLAPGKPLVLIGHCMGGLLIKEAIMQMLRRAESKPLAIVNSIAGIFFFDTPHTGIDVEPLKGSREWMNRDLRDSSLVEAGKIVDQMKPFEQLFAVDGCEIVCFHATRESPKLKLVDGKYQAPGPMAMLFKAYSAASCKPLPHVSFQTVTIEANHAEMIQFNPHDFVYVTKVLPRLQKYRKRGETRSEIDPGIVFRLRGIPPDCSIDELPSLITTCFSVPRATSIHLGSMATDPIDSTELTATLSFSRVPVKLSKKFSRHGSGDEWHFHQLKVGRFHNVYLVLDKHFRGLTPLNSCADDKCGTDLVALSGLNGHAFGSFKVKGDSFMWLRDSLPAKLPGTRILIYGYDTQLVGSRSFQTLQDLGMSFRDTLHTIEAPKPTILLGHSLGGLVAKQAMAAMNKCATPLDVEFLRSVQGILFFGTPQLGMDISSLIPLVGENPNIVLLNSLKVDSAELTTLATEFEKALMHGGASIRSFHETVESPTAIMTQVETDGSVKEMWSMRGPPAKLVSVRSATYGAGQAHPINRDHSGLVKFDGPYDHIYRHTLNVLRGMVRKFL